MLFIIYVNDLPDDAFFNIAICIDDTFSLLLMWSCFWFMTTATVGIWPARHCRLEQKIACWFQCLGNLICFFECLNNCGDVSVEKKGSLFKKLRFPFSSRLDAGDYFVCIAKTTSKKIGTLIYSIKSLYFGVTCFLYNFTVRSWIEYCCHPWAGTASSLLDKLNKLEKWVCMTVSPELAASLELLTNRLNIASLNLSYRH